MPNAQGSVTITPDSLNTSFQTYRQDLLVMPEYGLDKCKDVITIRPNVRYKETVGQLDGDMELGPYDPTRRDDDNVTVTGRTLETFLGSSVKGFDPNSVVKSIYGSNIVQGDGLKGVPITLAVWTFLMGKLGAHLYKDLFTAKRDDAGKTTATLFNGFRTIADNEITAGTMSAANGNYLQITEALTEANAEDIFNKVYDACDDHLQDEDTIFLCSKKNKRLYEKSYQLNHGSLPYNQQFQRTYLDGESNCKIIGLGNVPADYFQITTQSNALVGMATEGDKANFEVRPSLQSHFFLDFVATMFMGCQFETISKEKLLVAEIKTA